MYVRKLVDVGRFRGFACGLAVIFVGAVSRAAGAQAPGIPDTPAGHTLRTWLEVLESGDRAQAEHYVKDVDPNEDANGLVSFHNQTGGFVLLSIESSEPLHLRFTVKEKDSPTAALGNLTDAALRERVLRGVEADLTGSYIDAPVAAKMNAAIEAHDHAGDYNSITDPDAFAIRLTNDLRAVSHDMHLHVDFSPFKMPERQEPTPEEIARERSGVLRDNCAFRKVEILPNNVGYLKFDAFMNADLCGPTASAAMALVAHTSALIIDLRENGGGDPYMVSYIATYLFDKPLQLNDLYYRKGDSTHQFWTLPSVPGERLANQPVFVLTSKRTFSGAEEFSYDLQTQKRATLVGETTGGGAHPMHGYPVADYFMIAVPEGKPINPVTHGDWEGKGVVPEVKVPAADALEKAQKLAAEKIQAQEKASK